MKKLFTYLCYAAAVLGAISCDPASVGGLEDNGDVSGGTDTPAEGVLTIKADKTEITADGSDCVTFTVMFGSEDVSTKKTMHIVKEFDGKSENLANGANVFSTTAPGTYKFSAYLYSGGEHVSENQIEVVAVAAESDVRYAQKVIGEQFTSTGCQSCPGLSTALKEVLQNMPGVLVPLSFHMDFSGISDPMSIEATTAFYKYHAFQGLPYFNLNFRKSAAVNTDVSSIIAAVREEMSLNPTTCGVAIETSYDASTRGLDVTAKITSNSAVRHKYHIFLVEDGITGYDQMGANMNYVHDNVVRKMAAPQVTGFDINDRQPFVPGVEVTARKTFTLDAGWKVENMRVVVAALTSLDGGATWTSNNANQCSIGGSADYELEQEGGEQTVDFEKHVAVWEFTGAWCTNCPSGYSNINYVVSRNDLYKDNVHVMAFHSNYSGTDDLALPDSMTDKIMSDMGVTDGFPSFLTEMRRKGGLVSGTDFRNSLVEAFEEYPAHCGVALTTSLEGGRYRINAKVMSSRKEAYRVAVYIVEDRVKYYQKDGSLTHDEYNHRHVVRRILSSGYRGDRMGDIDSGSEASQSYEGDVDAAWNLENTYVYALAINAEGHVNNMNVCLIGQSSDYKRL